LFTFDFYYIIEDSAERADVAENQIGKLRAKSRSSVSVSRLSPGVSKYSLMIFNALNSFSAKFVNQLRFDRHQFFVVAQFVPVN
jgi:hypothetical protein